MINVYSNLRCVVHNGINAAQLLEDHEEHANKHSPSCRSHEQIRELSPLRRPLHTMIITSIDAHIHARTQSDTIGQIMVNLRSSNHLFLKRRLDVRDLVLCHNMCCAKSLQRLFELPEPCHTHAALSNAFDPTFDFLVASQQEPRSLRDERRCNKQGPGNDGSCMSAQSKNDNVLRSIINDQTDEGECAPVEKDSQSVHKQHSQGQALHTSRQS